MRSRHCRSTVTAAGFLQTGKTWSSASTQQAYVLLGVPVPQLMVWRPHRPCGKEPLWLLCHGHMVISVDLFKIYHLNIAASPSFGERGLGGTF